MASGSAAPPTKKFAPSPQEANKVVRNTSSVDVYFSEDADDFAVGNVPSEEGTLLEPGEVVVTTAVTYFATDDTRASLSVEDYEGDYNIAVPVEPETIAVPTGHVVTNHGPDSVYWDTTEADADATNGTELAADASVETAALTYFACDTDESAEVTVRDPDFSLLDRDQLYAAVKAILTNEDADDTAETLDVEPA